MTPRQQELLAIGLFIAAIVIAVVGAMTGQIILN